VSEDVKLRCCESDKSRSSTGLIVVSFVTTDVELKCGDVSREKNKGGGVVALVASVRKRFAVRARSSRSRAWRNLGLSEEASIVDRLNDTTGCI